MPSTNEPGSLSEHDVIAGEMAAISKDRHKRLGEPDKGVWCGIGLSGGGIRSASLALGALQAFAENNLLKHFDYISTVSGGGYLGSSLQWWWAKSQREDQSPQAAATFGLGPTDFPYGPAHPSWTPPATPPDLQTLAKTPPENAAKRGPRNLAFLRDHSSYLTPGDGVNQWSMIGVLLRTVIISLLIWVPLLTLAFAAINYIDVVFIEQKADFYGLIKPLGSSFFGKPDASLNIPDFYRWTKACTGNFKCELRYPAIFAILLIVFYLIAFLFLCAAALFALVSRAPQETTVRGSIIKFLIGLVLAAGLFYYLYETYPSRDFSVKLLMTALVVFSLVATCMIAADRLTGKHLNSSYALRRFLEEAIGKCFPPALAILAIASVPLLPLYISTLAESAAGGATTVGTGFNRTLIGGAIGIIGGTASALYSYYVFIRSIVPNVATQIALTIGAALYLYATLAIAYVLSLVLLHSDYIESAHRGPVLLTIIGAIGMAFAIGTIANINYVGLHRFYRDRLMEAFMPTDTAVSLNRSYFSPIADSLNVSDLKSSLEASSGFTPRPYPLINSNVILIGDSDKRVAARGGDNFIISPLFVGSTATGWQATDEYIAGNGPLTLATATAASGAAATASAGYIGTGVTMNPIVAAAMAFLNIRLGLWIGNPKRRRWIKTWKSIPTFLQPGLYSGIFARSRSRNSAFIELTDGGHFENLALYELVRRKLGVIVIVDGEADPDIGLSSLVSATHRIEQDFGARLDFIPGKGPEGLIMYPEKGYPKDLKFADRPFVVGKLTYNDNSIGALIYIKSTLIKQMDFKTAGYLARNPEFPHQSTVDQFFDPNQFDAYRLLGYESARIAIVNLNLAQDIRQPKHLVP